MAKQPRSAIGRSHAATSSTTTEAEAARRRSRRLRRGIGALVVAVALVVVAAAVGYAAVNAGGPPKPIDGISCDASTYETYHVHAHLELKIDGAYRDVPPNIGIPEHAGCGYWIHTHADYGLIHVEAPVAGTYTLGTFFHIWGYPLGDTQVGPYRGKTGDRLFAFVNGTPWTGVPNYIPLNDHFVIELQLGTEPSQPGTYTFPNGY